MKQFILKSAPFIVFIMCYALLGEYLLYQNKESILIERVSDIQIKEQQDLYYGREILGNSLSNYKFQMFRKKKADVLILGQSVVLQFRDFMFSPFQNKYYNTGLMARNVKDLNYVLDLIEREEVHKPKLVLLGVDFSFFLRHTFLDDQEWVRNFPEDRARSAKSHLKGMQRIFRNSHLFWPPKEQLGFGRAGMRGRGYRKDGSFRHADVITRYLQDSSYNDGHLLGRLYDRKSPFNEPFAFDLQKEFLFHQFLVRLQKAEIEFILYFPPYSDAFFTQAIQDESFGSFWKDYMKVQVNLKERGLNLIEFITPAQMGLTDHYMVDAEHAGEVLCALQLRKAVKSGQIKGAYIDQLDFRQVDALLEQKAALPFSFMSDSISKVQMEKAVKQLKKNQNKDRGDH